MADSSHPVIGIMQVIETLYLKNEEPHDYLHIKHERALFLVLPETVAAGSVVANRIG